MRRSSVAVTLLALTAAPAFAQGPRLTDPPSPVVARLDLPPAAVPVVTVPDSIARPRTQWKKGGIIGGAIGGVTGGVFGYGACQDAGDDPTMSCVGYAMMGAVLLGGMGFIVGALIGGLFPASP